MAVEQRGRGDEAHLVLRLVRAGAFWRWTGRSWRGSENRRFNQKRENPARRHRDTAEKSFSPVSLCEALHLCAFRWTLFLHSCAKILRHLQRDNLAPMPSPRLPQRQSPRPPPCAPSFLHYATEFQFGTQRRRLQVTDLQRAGNEAQGGPGVRRIIDLAPGDAVGGSSSGGGAMTVDQRGQQPAINKTGHHAV